jgi:hypothetical protein
VNPLSLFAQFGRSGPPSETHYSCACPTHLGQKIVQITVSPTCPEGGAVHQLQKIEAHKHLILVVGVTGFEPATPTSRMQLKTRIRDSIRININTIVRGCAQVNLPDSK